MPDTWEQQENESVPAYTRFLIYRNLGPHRNLKRANEVYAQMAIDTGTPPEEARNFWGNDSAKWHWRERAQAWDLANLQEHGKRLALKHMAYLEALLERAYAALMADEEVGPKTWTDHLGAAHGMAEHIPAATIAAAVSGLAQRDAGNADAGLLAEIRHINAQVESCTVKMLPERARGLPHAGPGSEAVGQADRDRPGTG